MAMLARLRQKNVEKWLGGWAQHLVRRVTTPRVRGPRHLLFAVCDHFEPRWRKPSEAIAEARVQAWEERYPVLARGYRDADGRPPRHSFFFPGEEYAPSYLDRLARLTRAGLGEVELHLHHDGDTADNLRRTIGEHLAKFASHGHLSRDPDGRLRYAFIHGNWALANPRRDGRRCGVDAELPLLHETGCYADFTFPSAPDESQPNIVNQIYWPTGDLARARSYEHGDRARVGEIRRDRILLIQGPLALARRPGRASLRIENGDLTENDPPTAARIASWASQRVHVQGRPEWVFVKVHTHGASEPTANALLGEPGHVLHRELTTRYNDGRRWILHYVTAREMYNVALAAMDGHTGDPNAFRDYVLPPPPAAR
jgi:hypothetical protein